MIKLPRKHAKGCWRSNYYYYFDGEHVGEWWGVKKDTKGPYKRIFLKMGLWGCSKDAKGCLKGNFLRQWQVPRDNVGVGE